MFQLYSVYHVPTRMPNIVMVITRWSWRIKMYRNITVPITSNSIQPRPIFNSNFRFSTWHQLLLKIAKHNKNKRPGTIKVHPFRAVVPIVPHPLILPCVYNLEFIYNSSTIRIGNYHWYYLFLCYIGSGDSICIPSGNTILCYVEKYNGFVRRFW